MPMAIAIVATLFSLGMIFRPYHPVRGMYDRTPVGRLFVWPLVIALVWLAYLVLGCGGPEPITRDEWLQQRQWLQNITVGSEWTTPPAYCHLVGTTAEWTKYSVNAAALGGWGPGDWYITVKSNRVVAINTGVEPWQPK